VIDIGTGDGLFVSHSARLNPTRFYIGVDANPRPLEKVSEKIHRRPLKGGLPNALFIQAPVENLPDELDSVANEVHVHFPWGTLLRGVATGEAAVLGNLRRICLADALLELVVGLHPERDRLEMERLGLRPLSIEYIDSALTPRYRNAGFEIIERGVLSPRQQAQLKTAWAKRLSSCAGRAVSYVIARVI